MPSQPGACSRDQRTSTRHKSTDDETNVAEERVSEQPRRAAAADTGLRAWNAEECRISGQFLPFSGNECQFGRKLRNVCNSLIQLSISAAAAFWASRAAHLSAALSDILYILLSHVWNSDLFFFFCIKSLTYKQRLSNASNNKHRQPTTQSTQQILDNRTKTCFLTFLSSLLFHLHTVTMTSVAPVAETEDDWLTDSLSTPAWDCGWAHCGTPSRQYKSRHKICLMKTRKKKRKESSFSISLFTAAWATGTENKHQTVKNTALNTLLGGVSQSAEGNKKEQRLHWARGANVVLPRQPHPPAMMGKQPGESGSRGHTQTHTFYMPLLWVLYIKKNNNIMVEWLQFLCHPSLDWLLLQLSKWPSSNLHTAVDFLIQLTVVSVKHTPCY